MTTFSLLSSLLLSLAEARREIRITQLVMVR
jgi:hypothetical protein